MTRAAAASGGEGTVTSRTPATSDPAAQYSRTSWPRRAMPVAMSVIIDCAPPACAGRSGVTGDDITAIFTAVGPQLPPSS